MDDSPNVRQRLPPSQVDCKWWKKGYCFRGDTCYFRHAEPLRGVDNAATARKEDNTQVKSSNDVGSSADSTSSKSSDPTNDVDKCSICLELPTLYGLLPNCDHVFCLVCIRDWRSSNKDNSSLSDPDWNEPTSTKLCPLCRTQSDFIVSSPVFPTPPPPPRDDGPESPTTPAEGDAKTQQSRSLPRKAKNPAKEKIISDHLAKLKKIPCRYFQKSVTRWQNTQSHTPDATTNSSRNPFRPNCYFGNGCHYAHTDPITGEPYVFSEQEFDAMQRRRLGRRRRIPDWVADDLGYAMGFREGPNAYNIERTSHSLTRLTFFHDHAVLHHFMMVNPSDDEDDLDFDDGDEEWEDCEDDDYDDDNDDDDDDYTDTDDASDLP